jgi:ferredoxin-NADP reductase
VHVEHVSSSTFAAWPEGQAPGTADVLADAAFDVVVAERIDLAEDVVGLKLTRADGAPLPHWDAGSHIDLIFPMPAMHSATRQYSLCGDPADSHSWYIAVLGDIHGRGGSRHLYDSIETGAVIQARGPRNHFPLTAAEEYLFLAGGIGITPIKPMIEAAQAAGARWVLHYAGRTLSRMAFASELSDRYPDNVRILADDQSGIPDLRSILETASPRTSVYSCGPTAMLDAVITTCRDLGLPEPHLERFSADPVAPGSYENRPVEVEFRQTGVTRTVSATESILDVAEELGSPIFGSCREGICGTCETRVLEGNPEHRDSLLSDQRRAEYMLICVSRSASGRLVLDA